MKKFVFTLILAGSFAQLQASNELEFVADTYSQNTLNLKEILTTERFLNYESRVFIDNMLYPQLLGIYGDLEFDRDVFINNQTAILDNLYDIIVLKNNSVINFSKTAFYIASFLTYNNQYNTLLHQVMTMMSKDPLYGPLNDKESKKAVKILKAYHYRNSLPGFISIPGGGISIDKTGLLESIDITIYAAKDDAMRKKKRKNSSNVK